ncbi:MAG: hypothetical protein J5701_05360 [Bacteroidales bacterium]|nr:hypothetical protein [Bacteroidales bacterium]
MHGKEYLLAGVENQHSLNIAFYITYFMLFIIAIALIGFTIVQIASDKNRIKSTLILLGIVAVITVIAYFTASGELSDVAIRLNTTTGMYKWAGTLLNIAYIMFFGVFAALIGSVVYTKIKK